MRFRRLAPICTLVALGAGAILASCGGGRSHTFAGAGLAFVGVVFDYDDSPAVGQPIQFVEAFSGGTIVGRDGRFSLPSVSPGSHILKVGDSVTTPTFFISVVTSEVATFLQSPIFLPLLESGITTGVPPFNTASIAIEGSNVDGVSLVLPPNSSVTYPKGAQQAITIVGIAPSRLPVPLPNGLTTRAAYAIEPHGVQFTPVGILTVPRLEDSSDGPWDLWQLDETGNWKIASAISVVGTASLAAEVGNGFVYAAVPRAPAPVGTVTGRVVSGGHPVSGYRVSCWNQVSDPTDSFGRFTLPLVPVNFPATLVRAYPDRPGLDYAPEVAAQVAPPGPGDVGDVIVGAPPPNMIPPTVISTSPTDGTQGAGLQTVVNVQFSTAMDPNTTSFSVRGTEGPVAGQFFFTNAFTQTFVPNTSFTPSDTFYITVDSSSSDVNGNPIDPGHLVFKFTTAAGTPPPPPTDQKIYGLSPLVGTASTLVTLFGRNFPGGSSVQVAGATALVRQETATTLAFLSPTTVSGQDAGVAVLNSALGTVSSLGPLVFDLRSSIASLSSASIVRADAPANLFVLGQNVSAGTVYVDGVAIAAIDSTELFGGIPTVVSKQVTLGVTGGLSSMVTGPVQVRGINGKPGGTYRFLQIRDGAP